MNLTIKPSFEKGLQKIDLDEWDDILNAIDALKKLKTLSESAHLKKMKGEKNKFRYRVGVYRIVFIWNKEQQTIIVERIAHRKDIY
jgi:mRNA-degrading endonuclease RelE of RelBE toxin-antitoxin system